jgi:hypothetical protein
MRSQTRYPTKNVPARLGFVNVTVVAITAGRLDFGP